MYAVGPLNPPFSHDGMTTGNGDHSRMWVGVEREDPTREQNVQEEEVRSSKGDFCVFHNHSGPGLIGIPCF